MWARLRGGRPCARSATSCTTSSFPRFTSRRRFGHGEHGCPRDDARSDDVHGQLVPARAACLAAAEPAHAGGGFEKLLSIGWVHIEVKRG